MNVSLTAFREPRGVMRILQFVFAICAFATISGYSGQVNLSACESPTTTFTISFGYPFALSDATPAKIACLAPSGGTAPPPEFVSLRGDFSSDAQFFVASGVLAFLYCMGIVVVYGLFEEKYQSNNMLPLIDFVLTTILAVLWLSSSAAWANSLTSIKSVTDVSFIKNDCKICKAVWTNSFSSLNISVLLGFLNFFLWASDLWFLYKETQWFKMRQESAGGV
ncbi:synaptophysin-like [Thrips palmi]|uniref:Synaptophysin-like n=1 Tax=Thrips palmi TaxID=161013 RepID=A0A6P8ZUI2_THRPL|nr:synaptophysin-like [Thrips palmi]